MQTALDLYTDISLSSFDRTTATGLSRLTDGAVGHHALTDLLNRLDDNNRTLWQHVKPLIRQIQKADALVLTDDSVAGKITHTHSAHSSESSVYPHLGLRYVKLERLRLACPIMLP